MKATTSVLLAQLLAGIAALLLATSCKKDKQGPPPVTDKVMQINFTTASINYNLVDSGYVIFKKEGSNTQYFKRFEKKPNTLSVITDDLPAGNWTAEMYVFTRFDDKAGRRFRQDKTFTKTATTESIQLNAPVGTITDAWKPSAFFSDAARSISVAVPLDCKDPHFDIEAKSTPWDYFYIERYANKRLQGGAKAKVAEGIWDCRGSCFTSDGIINNNTFFIPFTQEVGNKAWDNGLIIIVIADDDGADVQFSYSYDI
jgi:hypothetical protein